MNMWRFIAERFPLKVTIPLTAILCASSLSIHSFGIIALLACFANVFISLLILRAVDDVCSVDVDKIKSPERGLPSGRINPNALMKNIIALAVLNIIINVFTNAYAFWLAAIISLYYFLFYRNIKRLPILIKPLFSNFIFVCIPVYASLVSINKFTFKSGLLGVFIYLSVIAHEYAHNVVEKDGDRCGLATYTDLLGTGGTAVLSLFCFVIAFVFGLVFWLSSDKPLLFLIMLIATMLHILVLEVRLLKKPSINNCKPFYIYGFTFFLLPLLSLIVSKLLF